MSRALTGQVLPWTNVILDIWEFLSFSQGHSSAREAKRSFYGAADAIFGKIGRLASEKVTLHLLKAKCIPVLLYGLEALPLNKSQISSIDFVINRFFVKLFNTNRNCPVLSAGVLFQSTKYHFGSSHRNFFRQN